MLVKLVNHAFVQAVAPFALVDALPRLAQCNVIALYWRRFERRFFPNGSEREWQQELQMLPVGTRESLVADPSGGPKQFVSGD